MADGNWALAVAVVLLAAGMALAVGILGAALWLTARTLAESARQKSHTIIVQRRDGVVRQVVDVGPGKAPSVNEVGAGPESQELASPPPMTDLEFIERAA
jgi:hypothetical protein